MQLPGGVPRFWGGRDVGEMGEGNRESDSLSQVCSKPKVTWRSPVSLDGAGGQQTRSQEGAPNRGWKLPAQQCPRCSSGFLQKIALKAENIPSEEIINDKSW